MLRARLSTAPSTPTARCRSCTGTSVIRWAGRAAPKKHRPRTAAPRQQVQPQAADEPGFIALCRKIEREKAFRCSNYKDTCLRRRISVRMRARSAPTYADYAGLLDTDPNEYERLLQTLTINVTKFF